MRYVIDSSVAAKWVLPEIDSDKALRFREEFSRGSGHISGSLSG
jgi:hypothetical protein